ELVVAHRRRRRKIEIGGRERVALDPAHQRVRERRPHERRMQQTRHAQVVEVTRLTGEQRGILAPLNGVAENGRLRVVSHAYGDTSALSGDLLLRLRRGLLDLTFRDLHLALALELAVARRLSGGLLHTTFEF